MLIVNSSIQKSMNNIKNKQNQSRNGYRYFKTAIEPTGLELPVVISTVSLVYNS